MCTLRCVLASRFLSREKKLNLSGGEKAVSSRPPQAHPSALCDAGDTQQPTVGGSRSSQGVRGRVIPESSRGSVCHGHGTLEVTVRTAFPHA